MYIMNSNDLNQYLKDAINDFRLPRYIEIPTVGLYLEQVAKYINGFLRPLGCAEITTSMISNYVKKGFITPPQKKQYGAEQIAHLIFITIVKNVLSLENIMELLSLREGTHYSLPTAYDYFCCELENMLAYVYGLKDEPEKNLGTTHSEEKVFLRNVIISVSHSIYLGACFTEMKKYKNSVEE